MTHAHDADHAHVDHDHSVIATLQSLVVAFVLAMAFRGFVLEGFVIPTGSMAPTLMGQHSTWIGEQTGYDYRIDSSQNVLDPLKTRFDSGTLRRVDLPDPMMDQRDMGRANGYSLQNIVAKTRGGDRILIIKCLYPFYGPDRFDVVVFKNPKDPLGDTENYIKRLVGLPGEKIWLADGDVFVGPIAHPEEMGDYEIQRKPEHVQRAVWQLIYDSDYVPDGPGAVGLYRPQPWLSDDNRWQIAGLRQYRFPAADETMIRWNSDFRPITDDTTYNMLHPMSLRAKSLFNVSDVRVSAAITPDQEGLATTLDVLVNQYVFEFVIGPKAGSPGDHEATIRMRPESTPDSWVRTVSKPVDLPKAGHVYNVEFWHVDQSMSIYINGKKAVSLEYDWKPVERIEHATGKIINKDLKLPFSDLVRNIYDEPRIQWTFSGSPVTLSRVKLDRDIFYRPESSGVGTNPGRPAICKPDQFFMCGDNSPASHDSRLWGDPHEVVYTQIDKDAYIVNRKLLLGKAWVVYFPAPFPLKDGGVGVIPDFSSIRFIR